jgi:hypothetical protein
MKLDEHRLALKTPHAWLRDCVIPFAGWWFITEASLVGASSVMSQLVQGRIHSHNIKFVNQNIVKAHLLRNIKLFIGTRLRGTQNLLRTEGGAWHGSVTPHAWSRDNDGRVFLFKRSDSHAVPISELIRDLRITYHASRIHRCVVVVAERLYGKFTYSCNHGRCKDRARYGCTWFGNKWREIWMKFLQF